MYARTDEARKQNLDQTKVENRLQKPHHAGNFQRVICIALLLRIRHRIPYSTRDVGTLFISNSAPHEQFRMKLSQTLVCPDPGKLLALLYQQQDVPSPSRLSGTPPVRQADV